MVSGHALQMKLPVSITTTKAEPLQKPILQVEADGVRSQSSSSLVSV